MKAEIMSQTDIPHNKGFTGRHMAIVMILFFGTIISVNLVMAYFANKSWTGLVVKNGYIASQSFNKDTQTQNELLALGWRGEMNYSDGQFDFRLTRSDQPMVGCLVNGKLSRPVHEHGDQALTFSHVGDGDYMAKTMVAPGAWDMTIKAGCEDNPAQFIQHYRFVVPRQ